MTEKMTEELTEELKEGTLIVDDFFADLLELAEELKDLEQFNKG